MAIGMSTPSSFSARALLPVLLDKLSPGQRADDGVRGEKGRRLEGERRLLGLRAGCPVQRQGQDRAAVLAAVAAGEEKIQQCLQCLDVLPRD
jgi:hypothetical protein